MLPLLALLAVAAAAPNKQSDPLWAEPTYGEWVEVDQVAQQPQPATAVEERQPLLATKWWDWVKPYLSFDTCYNLLHFRTGTQ